MVHRKQARRWVLAGCAVALVGVGLGLRQPERPPAGAPGGMDIAAMGPRLVESLKKSPGCYGADAGRFQSGKMVIFAWFEDREAALAWHGGATHKMMSHMITRGADVNPEPMRHVPDDVPLMLLASMSPGADGQSMALAIEVYTPLAGGLAFDGGSFAPEAFKAVVEKMKAEASAE